MKWRRGLVGGCVVLSLVATACSDGGDDPRSESASTESSTESSTDGSSDPSSTADDTGTDAVTTEAASTEAASTEAPSTTAKPRRLYEEMPPPELPDERTPPFPSKGTLPDGTYWVTYNGGDESAADVDVVQAYFGAACEAKAAELDEECLDGILVIDPPKRRISAMPYGPDAVISVSDEATQKSYFVTPKELVKVFGGSAGPGAPAGYSYVPFAYLMRVRSGQITRFRQVWTP